MCKGKTKKMLYVLCCSVVFALALVLLDYEYHATLQTTNTKIGTDGPGTTECFFVGGTMGSQIGFPQQNGDFCFSQVGGVPVIRFFIQ